jgi:hypothetical protein
VAQDNLLWAAAHGKKKVEYFLYSTLGLSGIVALLALGLIWFNDFISNFGSLFETNILKALGSFVILDVLGMLVTLILSIFASRNNEIELKLPEDLGLLLEKLYPGENKQLIAEKLLRESLNHKNSIREAVDGVTLHE